MSGNLIENNSGNFGAWIPQLFYDVIARVIPGFFILFALLMNVLDFDLFYYYFKKILMVDKNYDFSTNLLILLGLGVSYISAIIFREIYCFISHPGKKNKNKVDAETGIAAEEINLTGSNSRNSCEYKTNDIALRYDFIKLKDIVNGNRITKLKAEEQMSGILFVGLTIASLINFILMLYTFSGSRAIILSCSLLMGYFCIRAKKHFSERLEMAVVNCSELLGYKECKQKIMGEAGVGK